MGRWKRRPPSGTTGPGGWRAVPSAVAASLAEELASLTASELVLLRAAAVAGEPFEPDLATSIAELVRRRTDSRRWTAYSRSTWSGRPRFRAGSPFATRSCAVRSTSRPRPAGGSRRTRARPPRWPRAAHPRRARPPRRAVRRPRRRGGDRAAAGRRSGGGGPGAGLGGALVRGGAPPASGRGRERQVDVRVALASSLRSVGELDRSRATLLEALELLPADATARRVELTAHCAAVEHWLGRHDEAHRRLSRAWEELPEPTTAEAVVLEIELAVDGLYELDFAQAIEMAETALATAREVGRRAADRGPRRQSCASPRRRPGGSSSRRRTSRRPDRHRRAVGRRDRTASRGPLPPRAGPRRTSSATRTRSRTPTAGSRSRGRSARAGWWCR